MKKEYTLLDIIRNDNKTIDVIAEADNGKKYKFTNCYLVLNEEKSDTTSIIEINYIGINEN